MEQTGHLVFFYIKRVITNANWHVYELEGVFEEFTYGVDLFIKRDLEINDEVVKDNAIGFASQGKLSDDWLRVLCAKYDLPDAGKPMKEQVVVEVSYLTHGNTKTAQGDFIFNAKLGPDYLNLGDLIVEVFPGRSLVSMYILNSEDADKVISSFY